MNLRKIIVDMFARTPVQPDPARAEKVEGTLRMSRYVRRVTRPEIDRAKDLADAFEEGDMALRGGK